MPEIPVARGERLAWEAAPERVRSAVEGFLGAAVVQAVTQPHGFSPAVASRLVTAAGRRAFLKAVPPDVNPDSPGIYRREIEVAGALPAGLPVPRLLWSLDEGPDGWVALLFEDVGGRPPRLPWRRRELRLAVGTVDELARTLTPAPLGGRQQGERMAAAWARWRELAQEPPADLEPWYRDRARELAALESRLAELTRGDTLVHLDIRSDNLLMDRERCWVVDWAWPLPGAAWMDAVLFALFVEGEGGPTAEAVLRMSEVGSEAPSDGVLALVCTVAGMFTHDASRPPPPGLPNLRRFQAAHARTARGWLRRLLEAP